MDNKEIKEIALKMFTNTKELLASAKKYNKEHNLTDFRLWSRKSQQVDISVWDDTKWDKQGRKYVESYNIRLDNKEVAKVKTHFDVREVFHELAIMFNEQKKVRGWNGLNYMTERISLESGTWSCYEVSIIPKVCLADTPCKEYNSLMNYINKYGNTTIANFEFFSASMGGKRGVLWDEYGERLFLDNKPKKCARILEELRKARTAKDIMVCKKGEENYIDEIDRKYSEYHELECEGEKRKYLEITIKTPTGKDKYHTKLY